MYTGYIMFDIKMRTFSQVCIRIKKSRARSKQIFSGAPTTDTAINAANYLVNNLSNLTSNINGSGKNYNSRRARSSRTATSKAGIKGRTTKNSNTSSMGNLMSRTLINHKQAEQ